MNYNRVNGVFYTPNDRTSMELTADIILDKTSVEVFIDGGAYTFSMPRKAIEGNKDGFHFYGRNMEVRSLEISTINSIWK
jgi:levanase/fructan beta-fructosidase